MRERGWGVMYGCGGNSAVQPHSMGGVMGGRRGTHTGTHTHTDTHRGTYKQMLHLPFSDLPFKKCPISVFQYSLAGRDGSGSGFGSWKTVPAVRVPLSVSGKNGSDGVRLVANVSSSYHGGLLFARFQLLCLPARRLGTVMISRISLDPCFGNWHKPRGFGDLERHMQKRWSLQIKSTHLGWVADLTCSPLD